MSRIRQVTQMELDTRDALSLCARSPQVLNCVEGELWITFDGCGEDIVLAAGGSLEFDGQCGVVISALQPSRLSLSSARIGRAACFLDPESLPWATVRRMRWRFPPLVCLPSVQLR